MTSSLLSSSKAGVRTLTVHRPERANAFNFDLILAAFNNAGRRVYEEVQRMTQGLTAGMRIPGLPI